MNEKTTKERIIFHDTLEVMEVDFSHMTFATREQIDEFYDEVDRQLEDAKRRWYFLVNYIGCVIQPEVWKHFAARGKHANITYGLGTVRIGATDETRETIREKAKTDKFRANLYATRDEAFSALTDMQRRRKITGVAVSES